MDLVRSSEAKQLRQACRLPPASVHYFPNEHSHISLPTLSLSLGLPREKCFPVSRSHRLWLLLAVPKMSEWPLALSEGPREGIREEFQIRLGRHPVAIGRLHALESQRCCKQRH